MHRFAAFLLLSAVSLAACGDEQPDALPDLSQGVQYWVDFGGPNVPIGDGDVAAGMGGWTLSFACAYRTDDADAPVGSLRFDDSRTQDWNLERDGGTPPPLARSGAGVSLRVEHDGTDTFSVTLELGGKVYAGTAADDASTVGFHHVSYATPPELLAIEGMRLTTDDGAPLTLTGTASFPYGCAGL